MEKLNYKITYKCEMTTGISVINMVFSEQLNNGINVECEVGERRTFKAEEQHRQGSGRKNRMHHGPGKKASVTGQKGECGNEAEEVDRARPC